MSFAQDALFDIIIVGSCAGGVLAARLSDNPNLRILLLEAGPDHRTATMSPEMMAVNPMSLWADPTWTWPDCKVRRTMLQAPRHYPIGRGAGGGSAINGMGAIRPSPQDFAEWEDMYGCEGWGWNTMLPCLRRLESDPTGAAWEPEAHGVEGPIPIFRQPLESWGPVARAMRLSALEKGYGESPDINSPTASGCVSFAYNVDPISLRRVSVNDGYIEKTRGRQNLMVRCKAVVDRVLFNEKKEATGVLLVSGEQILCRCEVIICAGALQSPAILQRSGVGPTDLLQSLGIPIVADVPGVGIPLAHPASADAQTHDCLGALFLPILLLLQ